MYRLYKRQKSKRRRLIIWLSVLCFLSLFVLGASFWLDSALQPKATINQSTAVTTQVSYSDPTKEYTEPGFNIALPTTWQLLPRQSPLYDSYTWQSPDRVTDGQELTVYEDTIPINYAVNRVLVVQGDDAQLSLEGVVSDNCSTFTKNPALPNSVAAPAEWNGVSFLCDQANTERDVIGTISADGINTVILKNPTTGESHKFFITYSDDSINPDYTIFYNALESMRLN